MAESGAAYRPLAGRTGLAQLSQYAASYCEWGQGPPVVLVPGLAGGFGLLGPLARLLARDYRVLSYHLRGEDDPFALRRHFTMADLVEDLVEFLDWHNLETPTVIGLSFGGLIALESAVRHPSRLGGLVVQGAGGRYETSLLKQVAGAVLRRYPLPTDSPFVNQFFNLLFGSKHRPEPLFDFVTRQCWQTDQSVMSHRFHLAAQHDLEDHLSRIRVPTLVLAGNRDLLVSERSLRTLMQGVPHATLGRLAGCGHLAFATHPERVAAEVRRFLGADTSHDSHAAGEAALG
jgi:pimeloyl-ACP methyl ester carboxylesterase